MTGQKPYRMMHKFWLDLGNAIEAELIDAIALLKRDRQFTAYIRDGLRLMLSLAKGDTGVLRELFPAVVRDIEESYHSAELARLNARLDEMTRIIEANGLKAPAEKPVQRRESIPVAATSSTIEVKKATGSSPGANFLAKMKAFKGAE